MDIVHIESFRIIESNNIPSKRYIRGFRTMRIQSLTWKLYDKERQLEMTKKYVNKGHFSKHRKAREERRLRMSEHRVNELKNEIAQLKALELIDPEGLSDDA